MKDILFRGKTECGKWVYGSLILAEKFCCILETGEAIHSYDYPYLDGELGIIDGQATPVIPETVGRLLDRAGYNCDTPEQKIFEGDIIEIRRSKGKDDGYLRMGIVVNESCITEDGNGRWFPQDTVQVKVVGNVYDNPELIGKKYADLYKYYHSYEGLEVIES